MALLPALVAAVDAVVAEPAAAVAELPALVSDVDAALALLLALVADVKHHSQKRPQP